MANGLASTIADEVLEAIGELIQAFGENRIEVSADNEGGAYIIVKDLILGDKYTPSSIWCGFRITHAYPMAQVYPHFVNLELKRKDGQPLGQGFSSPVTWHNLQTVQISRSSKNWNPATDTAYIKLQKVLLWIQSQ